METLYVVVSDEKQVHSVHALVDDDTFEEILDSDEDFGLILQVKDKNVAMEKIQAVATVTHTETLTSGVFSS